MQKPKTSHDPNKEINELDNAISILLDHGGTEQNKQIVRALENIFDLLLWAEKRNSKVLDSVFQLQLLTLLIEKYGNRLQTVLSGMTLLLTNAKEGGILATHILQRKLGDKILTLYLQSLSKLQNLEQEEHLHVLGSLLRAYHRHFQQNTFHLFIQNGQCLLIDICCKFFNCPEQITRTSVMNIFMSILKVSFIDQLTTFQSINSRVGNWCKDMCRLFRNQLKDFDQHLLITDQQQSEFIINSINDKIILWQDLSALNPQLFAPHFYAELMVPLIVGSLNTNGIPLFTLKFSLFLVNKLIPTISKLNLLNELGNLLFSDRQIQYSDDQLGTVILRPFSLKKLLKDQTYQIEEQQLNIFKHLNQFFMSILKSKDGRFLECVCILMVNLLSSVKKSPQAISFYVKELGFGIGGSTVTQISHIMITHFTAIHSLEINRIIAALLIYIQPAKYLDQALKNRLVHIFKGSIDQALLSIDKQRETHPFLAEILQYDIRTIQSKEFSLEPVIRTDSSLLFNNHIIENQSLPFFQQLPETAINITRYQIVKSLFLRNVVKKLVQECFNDNSIQRYMQKVKAIDAKYIKSGEHLRLPISVNSYRCKLEDSKVTIPTCLILDDENNLIVGYLQEKNIRVISNFKYKHVYTQIKSKKDLLYIQISTSRYNNKTQQMDHNKQFILKQLEVGEQYFRIRKNKVIAHQMASICDILKNAKRNLPEFSLL